MRLTSYGGRARRLAPRCGCFSHEKRLLALCRLAIAGEMSVGALAEAVGLSQSALSQHLAKLRADGLVETRREAQVLHYRISDPRVGRLLAALYEIYCAGSETDSKA